LTLGTDVPGDLPEVSVWAPTGAEYSLVGSILAYDSLTFEPHYLEPGTWEMTLPFGGPAQSLVADCLCTIDWRGKRTTWTLDTFNPASSPEGATLTVGGPSALSLLGRELAWPSPAAALTAQASPPPLTSGDAETVVRSLVSDNWVTRRGEALALGTNGNRGSTVRARPKFDNLLDLVTRKARTGGIGVDINLLNSSSTRASLRMTVWIPADLTTRVRLSEKVGNLLGWTQTNTAPTATRAIVTGATGGTGDIYKLVTTAEGDAAAADWGGHRVVLVQGPASYDNSDLIQAGEEALDEGVVTTNVALEASDTSGLQAFRDYGVGDLVTGQLTTGLDVEDVISSIRVDVGDGYPEITPMFGKPNADDPMVSMAELVRHLNRRIRLLEQRS
jgi:hypothetical protein